MIAAVIGTDNGVKIALTVHADQGSLRQQNPGREEHAYPPLHQLARQEHGSLLVKVDLRITFFSIHLTVRL